MQVATGRTLARPRHTIVRLRRHPIIRRRRHAILRYSLVARHSRINCSSKPSIETSKPSIETSKPSIETSKPSIKSTRRKTAESARLRNSARNSARLRICALRGGNCGENGGSEKHRADFDEASRYAHSPLPSPPALRVLRGKSPLCSLVGLAGRKVHCGQSGGWSSTALRKSSNLFLLPPPSHPGRHQKPSMVATYPSTHTPATATATDISSESCAGFISRPARRRRGVGTHTPISPYICNSGLRLLDILILPARHKPAVTAAELFSGSVEGARAARPIALDAQLLTFTQCS